VGKIRHLTRVSHAAGVAIRGQCSEAAAEFGQIAAGCPRACSDVIDGATKERASAREVGVRQVVKRDSGEDQRLEPGLARLLGGEPRLEQRGQRVQFDAQRRILGIGELLTRGRGGLECSGQQDRDHDSHRWIPAPEGSADKGAVARADHPDL